MSRDTSIAALCACALLAAPCEAAECSTGFVPAPRFVAPSHLADQSGKKGSPLKNAVLPAKWDARDYGWITPVKDQGSVGACWAFAVNAVIETQLRKSGKGTWDLSEKNMVNLHGWDLEPLNSLLLQSNSG